MTDLQSSLQDGEDGTTQNILEILIRLQAVQTGLSSCLPTIPPLLLQAPTYHRNYTKYYIHGHFNENL